MLISLLALMMSQDAAAAGPPLVEIPRPLERRLETAEAVGHTGDVTVEVLVNPDGSKGPVTVVTSSRSELLDAEAMRLTSEAGFRAPAEPTRYRLRVGFSGANEEVTCGEMARQVRWFAQAWPEKPGSAPILNMSSGILLMAGMPDTPNRETAAAQGRMWNRFKADYMQVVEACEREPDRAYFPMLGEWARRGG